MVLTDIVKYVNMAMIGEMKMLREKLKDMDLRITELADYLQISRPTMYKFIDYYEESRFDEINKKTLKLFNYIMENELAGKKSVINYILNNLVEVKDVGGDEENGLIKTIKKYIISNPESKKSQFLKICTQKDIFDELIFYLVDISEIIKKRKLTDEESLLIEPYKEIVEKIKHIRKGE